MAKQHLYPQFFFTILAISSLTGVYSQATFTFINRCSTTIWPGILSSAGIDPLPTTGFVLQTGESRTLNAPSSWGGRFWGRTHCSTDSAGRFSCVTGDCGSGTLECSGAGATPPATLAEFKLDGDAGKDFYDVSLVDGYNLPMLVVPQGGTGSNCSNTGCIRDLNSGCPSELRVASNGEGVACRSACEAFKSDEYCCSGAHATPDTCRPSQYSQAFKSACPSAYSYAYDDGSSTFTCVGADYTITFCPSPTTSQRTSSGSQNPDTPAGGQNPGSGRSPGDSGMVYQGGFDANGASSTCKHVIGFIMVVAMWWWVLVD